MVAVWGDVVVIWGMLWWLYKGDVVVAVCRML